MPIALRWREEPYTCEFRGGPGGGSLTVFEGADVVWKEQVPSAAAAHDRAREIRSQLTAPRAKHA